MADMTEEALHRYAAQLGIPDYMQGGLIQHILNGRPTGHFLTAVLSNDLKEAVARADENNQRVLVQYVIFLHNHAPIGCWGSPENVKNWRDIRGYRGLTDAIKAKAEGSEPTSV